MDQATRVNLWRLKANATLRQALTEEEQRELRRYQDGDEEERTFAACVVISGVLPCQRKEARDQILSYIAAGASDDPLLQLCVCEALQFIRETQNDVDSVRDYLKKAANAPNEATSRVATTLLQSRYARE